MKSHKWIQGKNIPGSLSFQPQISCLSLALVQPIWRVDSKSAGIKFIRMYFWAMGRAWLNMSCGSQEANENICPWSGLRLCPSFLSYFFSPFLNHCLTIFSALYSCQIYKCLESYFLHKSQLFGYTWKKDPVTKWAIHKLTPITWCLYSFLLLQCYLKQTAVLLFILFHLEWYHHNCTHFYLF